MRDISDKPFTQRSARAMATISATGTTVAKIMSGQLPKGEALSIAKVAAINAAKNTSQIIPYCHQLPIDWVEVEFQQEQESINIFVRVKAIYKTGVEMEALTAVSVAALTLYDMAKQIDEKLEITAVRLLQKTGGKSDFNGCSFPELSAAVLVISDSVSQGQSEDRTGDLIVNHLQSLGIKVESKLILPDAQEQIRITLTSLADHEKLNLLVTTGGTGLGPHDVTPEATAAIIDKEIPGLMETARSFGQSRLPYAMLSRALAGMRGDTLIINLPGSPAAVRDYLSALFPHCLHIFPVLAGKRH